MEDAGEERKERDVALTKRFNELGIQITVPQRLAVRDGPDGDPL